jgi:penicillin-binding protein 1B
MLVPLPRPVRLIAVGVTVVALAATALALSTAVELARFERAHGPRGTRLYASGQRLAPGVHVRAVELDATLVRLGYREVGGPPAPGQFRRLAGAWDIHLRAWPGSAAAQLRLELDGPRIRRVLRDGREVPEATLEPEVIAAASERAGELHRPVRLAEVPPAVLQAVLAAEDHRFFDHAGVDVHGLGRALWANLRAGRVTQGGSTITQQLVRTRLLGRERTLGRKLHEAWLATVVEWRYPKTQILEAYLNEIYLGQYGGLALRGVGAAAHAYFGKALAHLTLGEAALLAGLIRAPNTASPLLFPERARQRREAVLARLHELGWITSHAYAAARAEPLRLASAPSGGPPAAFFLDAVRQELHARLGDEVEPGTDVYTTLDLPLQRFAEAAVRRGLARLEESLPRLRGQAGERLEAVLIALHPATGHILALVGGREYRTGPFNRALFARRQPGSAFKPFVYAAALTARDGAPPFTAASLVDDTPLTLEAERGPWSPRNDRGRYEGRVTVRRALERSLNAATVRIAQQTGLERVVRTARALGVRSPLRPVPAVVLGAFEVTPLELARAYLPFANGGRRLEHTTTVRAVTRPGAAPSELPPPATTAVLTPAEAYLITALLQGVMTSGTGAAARALGVEGPVAGKTGTTNEGRDAWFVGYTPRLLALVWVGFDRGLAHGLSGAEAALPIWADFMRHALDAYPTPAPAPPPGVQVVQIDPTTGRAATPFCPVAVPEVFLAGTVPPPCEAHAGPPADVLRWWRRLWEWWRR